jgi:hypothetical protein
MGIYNMWFKRKFKKTFNKIKEETLIEPEIIYSGLYTPDGTLLESLDRHDYKVYEDTLTKKNYMIDGGHEYIRRSNHGDEKVITITSNLPHDIIRLYAFRTGWGNPKSLDYGKNRLLTRICYMDDEYLEASINYVTRTSLINGNIIHLNILLDEQIYRIKNNVVTFPISLSEIIK